MDLSPFFEKTKIGSLEIENRIAMAPMTRSFSPGGIPTEDVAAYYERRAKGGVGLIITEGTNLSDPTSPGYADVPVMTKDTVAAWKNVTDRVHSRGGKIAIQLWHVGALRGKDFDLENSVPSHSPSGIFQPVETQKPHHSPKEMTDSDIADALSGFATGAACAVEAGFDAIEIHGAHGYLIDQFFWKETNKRNDKYAESAVFAKEVISSIREAVGPDLPLILRFSNWKLGAYEQHLYKTPEEFESFLKPILDTSIDGLHASSRNFNDPEFEGSEMNLAGWTKKISGLPTISVGSVGLQKDFISSFMECEGHSNLVPLAERLRGGEFDMIAVGRSLLADPDWPNKVKENRLDEILPYGEECITKLY